MQLPRGVIDIIHRYVIDSHNDAVLKELSLKTILVGHKLLFRHCHFNYIPTHPNHCGEPVILDKYRRCDNGEWRLKNEHPILN